MPSRQTQMQRKVRKGEAIDLSKCRRTGDGDYILPKRIQPPKHREPKDYCDTQLASWIWSIGRNKRTGQVVASLSGRFYGRRGWECIWLR